MANCVIYKFNDPEKGEIKLKLDANAAQDLELRFNDSLYNKIHDITRLSTATEFVAAAIVGGTYKEKKAKAAEIYDDMIDAGKTIEGYHALIYDLVVSAGFIKAADVENALKAAKANERIQALQVSATMATLDELEKKASQKP